MEKTLVIVKPDGFEKKLSGEIMNRFYRKGYELLKVEIVKIAQKEIVETHYEEHKGKDFYERIVHFMSSGPIMIMIWQGNQVVSGIRNLLGSTDPAVANPGTIRGDFGNSLKENICHASDSVKSAQKEIDLWFP